MKKFVTAILALAMVLSLAACGEKKVQLKILDTEYAVEDYAIAIAKENTDLLDEVNAALAAITADGTAQKIVDKYISGTAHDLTFQADAEGKPELIMATNAFFPPYEFYENDTVVGIDAEMAAAIADQMGRKLTIVDTEFGSIIGGVQTGKYDMGMAGMTVTPDRQASVNFSESYATGVQVVILREDSPIKTLEDLLPTPATRRACSRTPPATSTSPTRRRTAASVRTGWSATRPATRPSRPCSPARWTAWLLTRSPPRPTWRPTINNPASGRGRSAAPGFDDRSYFLRERKAYGGVSRHLLPLLH